jgi:hypothetical protein
MPKRIESELPAVQGPPIEWPKVTIGGYELEIKQNFQTIYRASKAGVDFARLQGSSGIGERMDLFAVMVAPLFEADDEPAPSGSAWAEMVESMDHYKLIVAAMDRAYELAAPKKDAAGALTPQPEIQGNSPN